MDRITHPTRAPEHEVEFVKGCALCEQSDAELERVFQEFAQWLYGVMIADQMRSRAASRPGDVDNDRSEHTLKERSEK
jgi:hypothetical protein